MSYQDGDDAMETWQRRVQEAILRGDLVSPLAMPRAKPPKWTDLIGMDPGYVSDARPNPGERLTLANDDGGRADRRPSNDELLGAWAGLGINPDDREKGCSDQIRELTAERDRARDLAARLEAELDMWYWRGDTTCDTCGEHVDNADAKWIPRYKRGCVIRGPLRLHTDCEEGN